MQIFRMFIHIFQEYLSHLSNRDSRRRTEQATGEKRVCIRKSSNETKAESTLKPSRPIICTRCSIKSYRYRTFSHKFICAVYWRFRLGVQGKSKGTERESEHDEPFHIALRLYGVIVPSLDVQG